MVCNHNRLEHVCNDKLAELDGKQGGQGVAASRAGGHTRPGQGRTRQNTRPGEAGEGRGA